MNFRIELGATVRDRITGYEGVVICRCQWLTNCNTYGVKSRKLKDGAPLEAQYFDEENLEVSVDVDTLSQHRESGGPTPGIRLTNR